MGFSLEPAEDFLWYGEADCSHDAIASFSSASQIHSGMPRRALIARQMDLVLCELSRDPLVGPSLGAAQERWRLRHIVVVPAAVVRRELSCMRHASEVAPFPHAAFSGLGAADFSPRDAAGAVLSWAAALPWCAPLVFEYLVIQLRLVDGAL